MNRRSVTKNAFGKPFGEIEDILRNDRFFTTVHRMFTEVLQAVDKGKVDIPVIIRILQLGKNYKSLPEYEKAARQALEESGIVQRIPATLNDRANIVYGHIKDYVEGTVLDLGCGDGQVGEYISKQKKLPVILADVYQNPRIAQTGLRFIQFKQGEAVPLPDNSADTTMLLMVLHHTDDPVYSIQEAKRVTKNNGKILVIESVYGVQGQSLSEPERAVAATYLSLDKEEQFMANQFFDHFYNRILHYSDDPANKVNVPFNFNTPEGWRQVFQNQGLVQVGFKELGIDMLTVPEYHTLHVLNVKK